jgi:hypothetical protein
MKWNFKITLHPSIFYSKIPPPIKDRSDVRTADGQCHAGHQINDIMISQVDCGEDETRDNREEDIEENFFVAVSQEEDHQHNLGMAAGHHIPFVML